MLRQPTTDHLPVDAFAYQAIYNAEMACVEMFQQAKRDVRARFDELNLSVQFQAGQQLRTEVSCKFTRETVEQGLEMVGLQISRWYTDPQDYFALALINRR